MFKNWDSLLDDAWKELITTFFTTNNKGSWSDRRFIKAMQQEQERIANIEARITEVLINPELWFHQLLKGYALGRSFGRKDQKDKRVFLQIVYGLVFPQLRQGKPVDLSNRNILQMQAVYDGSSLNRQLSAISKVCALTAPLHFWIYDSQARSGLKKMLRKRVNYENNYPKFQRDLNSVWETNRSFLINYIEGHILPHLRQQLVLPRQFEAVETEILARRFLDKILMTRNKQVDLYPVILKKGSIPISNSKLTS